MPPTEKQRPLAGQLAELLKSYSKRQALPREEKYFLLQNMLAEEQLIRHRKTMAMSSQREKDNSPDTNFKSQNTAI